MRMMMTPEMKDLFDEIKPYFDPTQPDCLRPDTPAEIRQKARRYDEMRNTQVDAFCQTEDIPE